MRSNLLDQVQVRIAKAAQGSDTAAVESDVIDMRGFMGVVFTASIATANAGNYIKVQQGDESDGSDMSDLEGTKVVADEDGAVVSADVYAPSKRYVRAVIVRGAATATGDLYSMQYAPSGVPVDNNVTGVIVSEKFQYPAEGAA